MKRKIFKSAIVLAIAALVGTVGYALISYQLDPAGSGLLNDEEPLVVKHVTREFNLEARPELWKDIQPMRIHLYPQSARVPHGTSEKELWVRAAYNEREIAFVLEFHDETYDKGVPVNPDACAIMLIPAAAPAAAQMMGYAGNANVWHWLADREALVLDAQAKGDVSVKAVRELIATGPGTQTPLRFQNVDGKGEYRDGKWSVVFRRALNSKQEGEFELGRHTNQKVAFALWDGLKMESFARKSISIVRPLILEKP